MGKKIYELVISIEVLSFINHTKEYTCERGVLSTLDERTHNYLDAQSFFDANKRFLYLKVRDEFEREYGYSPTDILLGENGVYIREEVTDEKGETQYITKRALFQNIDYAGKSFELSDIIKKKLYKGNIKKFYECDQFRCELGGYDSFFDGLDNSLLDRIKMGIYTSGDVVWLWEWIKDSKRICPLMRFLLMDLDKFEGNINEYFYEAIPEREKIEVEKRPRTEETTYSYRPPYKDD